jgi:HlyD family secretion protein
MKGASTALTLTRRKSPAEDPVLPAILEFQWPSTAIVNAPIPRSASAIAWVISSMVLVLAVLMGVIPVDQVVTARGVVVSQSPTILVQPLETAIVRSIDVRDGQLVRSGEILAHLDPTFAAADASALSVQVAALGATVARLQAEATGQSYQYSPADPNQTLQAAIFNQRQAERQSTLDSYDEKIASLKASVTRDEAAAGNFGERLGVATRIENMRKQLQRQQFDTTMNELIATDTRLTIQGDLENAQNAAATDRRDLNAMIAQRDAYIQNWKAAVSQDLADNIQKLNDAREELNKATLRRKLMELRAARDAVVQSVAKVSVGSVLQSGQEFITLVPVDVPLEVEVIVPGSDNGFVHVGDPVAIKFDTFPYSQYGLANGSVRIVSPDSFTAQDEARNPTSAVPVPAGSTELFYEARIAITHIGLHGVPAGFRVVPGMPVTADVKVGQRTVLSYLLGRVLPVTQEGMREP